MNPHHQPLPQGPLFQGPAIPPQPAAASPSPAPITEVPGRPAVVTDPGHQTPKKGDWGADVKELLAAVYRHASPGVGQDINVTQFMQLAMGLTGMTPNTIQQEGAAAATGWVMEVYEVPLDTAAVQQAEGEEELHDVIAGALEDQAVRQRSGRYMMTALTEAELAGKVTHYYSENG